MTLPSVHTSNSSTLEVRPGSRIAVVIPAYNEAEHLAAVISSVPSWVERILVVDDASEDGTAAVAEACGDSRLVILRRDHNGGVGAAMKAGYRACMEAGFDVLIKMDGDGQMHGDELARLVGPLRLGLADYAKGNRFYFPNATKGMPVHRSIGSTILSFMTKLASGYWHVFDSQCGFTAVSSRFLELIDLDNVADDYFFENDMLMRLNSLNARVVDVPVSTVYGAEVSGLCIGRVAVSFPPRLILGGARRFWRKHMVTDFGAIAALTVAGMALTIFGGAFGAYRWWDSIATQTVTTTGTVMIAVLPLVVGLQFLIQALSMSVAASPGAAETAEYIRRFILSEADTTRS